MSAAMAASDDASMKEIISIPASSKDVGTTSRIHEDGSQITYKLEVVQEPERARACGHGAKSSSDRRPVDPPPVVKLRILQADNDITFAYNANFFLFATLENARQIAHGRVPQPSGITAILTGTPVAGMSYLDRPEPAGYFIFPDLSVRHEGKYRLSFTLYEELKDQNPPATDEVANVPKQTSFTSFVHARCHVKSNPFDVFSAKKFPGLSESTQLSRLVADQGCRVRIRRDVRMRRRDSKQGKDWDNDDDDQVQDGISGTGGQNEAQGPGNKASSHPSAEPIDRPRSIGHGNQVAPFHPPHRQTSSHEIATQYSYGYSQADQHGVSQPYPQQEMYDQNRGSQYQQSPYMAQQPGPQQSPSTPSFAQSPYRYGPSQVGPVNTNYGYSPQQPLQQTFYDQQHHLSNQTQENGDFPVPNTNMPRPPPPQYTSQGQLLPSQWQPTVESMYRNNPNMAQQNLTYQNGQGLHMTSPNTHFMAGKGPSGQPLPPLKYDTPQAQVEVRSPLDVSNAGRPPFQRNFTDPIRNPPPVPFTSQINSGVSSKRTFGTVFNTHHMNQPMRSGARPQTEGPLDLSESSEEDLQDLEQIRISYRRADGTQQILSPAGFDQFQ